MALKNLPNDLVPYHVAGIAIEDDAVYFTVAQVDSRPGTVIAAKPQVTKIPRPLAGYSVEFIESCLRTLDEQNAVPLSGIGISMFGTIRTDDYNRGSSKKVDREDALIAVPRLDWLSPDHPPLIFKHIVPRWKNTPVFVQNDSTTSALTDYYRQPDRESCPGFVYVRLGTGLGGGVLWNGVPRPGRIHPEIGHGLVIRRSDDTLKESKCRVHQKYGCLEGFTCEAAILERVGVKLIEDIPDDHAVWELIGHYLAQACMNIVTTLAPDRIAIGGRTMRDNNKRVRQKIYGHIHTHFKDILKGYPKYDECEATEAFIRPAQTWVDPSLWGAIELARQGVVPPKLRGLDGGSF